MAVRRYLVFDMGASNGRAVVARFDGTRFTTQVTHRFDNRPVRAGGTLYWDILALFLELKIGIQKSLRLFPDIASLGVDSWGADFALIDGRGSLLANPIHYRDERRQSIGSELFEMVSPREMFDLTGIFIAPLLSIFQLYAMKVDGCSELACARRFLMIPDFLNYLLTGEQANELSNAVGTAAFSLPRMKWEARILDRCGIPTRLFSPPVMPGTGIGLVQRSVRDELGCPAVPVIAPATHDTASAVAGIPAADDRAAWAFIAIGTWCVVGMEVESPVMSTEVFESGFGNEGGMDGRCFLARNLTGLWILQQCRDRWARDTGKEISWDVLVSESVASRPFGFLIDTDDPALSAPNADMPETIARLLRQRGMETPAGRGETARCVYESLVLKFRVRVEQLERLAGRRIELLHLVGGGTRNVSLCQWTADVTGRDVIAGPTETTVAGNLIAQMKASGDIRDIEQGRRLIALSSETRRYVPKDAAAWDQAYERYTRTVLSGRTE
jgi:sugar (pentulose or hexulose) kinase